jgi:integrase
LQTVRKQEYKTARHNAFFVVTFLKSGKTPDAFVSSYTNSYTYNNYLKAVNHYCDFMQLPRPSLKPKPKELQRLIIAPKPEEIREIINKLPSLDVKCYIGLCSTTGLRCERLLLIHWSKIDFDNGIVNMNERHGKKVYRPNGLHKDVAKLLKQLRQQTPREQERVFTFGYKKVAQELKAIGTKWRPNNCRDFFYNFARKYCDKDQVEWLMGHSLPGVRAHYLADELKQEYAKFEEKFRLT